MDIVGNNDLGAVLFVKVDEVRLVLEVVGIQFAIVKSGVRKNIVVKNLDLKGISLGCKVILDGFENLGVRRGACADYDGLIGIGLVVGRFIVGLVVGVGIFNAGAALFIIFCVGGLLCAACGKRSQRKGQCEKYGCKLFHDKFSPL